MKVVLFLFIFFSSFFALSQDSGTIKGVLKANGYPVEFANVFLTLKKDTTKIISGTVSDSLGRFSMEKLAIENYTLHVQMVGFISSKIDVSIKSNNQIVDLHEISIKVDELLLQSIEVTAIRDIVKKTEEGFVMNAADNLTQIGGTAADLLRNMPGVLVGSEGDITIRGKNPLTYINGRISGIAGIDRAAQLDRIPASSIERIEIINNPSSKYDADAEGGVINIILKKNQDIGTNGAFALGAGLGSRYRLNGSLLLNHRTSKWNIGAAYDNWYTTRTRKINGDRTNYDIPSEYYLTQRRFDERLIFYQNAKTTIDYTPNKYNSLSLEAIWAFPGENNGETLQNTNETLNRNFTNKNQRYSNEIRRSNALEFALNYIKRFADPDKQLSITMSDTYEKGKENTGITTQYLTDQNAPIGDSFSQRTYVYEATNLGNAAIDYTQPITKHSSIETGYKGISRILNSNYGRSTYISNEYVIDPIFTNIFDFNEQIHAVYAQYIGWTGEKQDPVWKYNLGLRAEKVWNHGETANQSDQFNNHYNKLYPSASLFYYTPKRNNVKLSYSRRINRPGLGQLNPFIDITDSLNQHGGNPHLKPEFIHSMELGYNHALSKGSISFTTFYRLKNHAILSYTVLNDNGVAFSQPLNFGNATTVGIEAIATYNPFSFWSMNFSFSAYQLRIFNNSDAIDISNKQFSWYSKLINNFTMWKGARLQLIGNYTSPVALPQGRTIAIYNIDMGFQQKVMKGNGRLGLSLTDIMNTQKSGSFISYYNFTFNRTSKLDTRAIMLTFGYTFNSTFKEKLMENRFKND